MARHNVSVMNGPGHGRKKGALCKFTRLRDEFLKAFKELGGRQFILDCAQQDPVTVLRIFASLIPKQVWHAGADGGPAEITIKEDHTEELRIILKQARAEKLIELKTALAGLLPQSEEGEFH